MPTDRVVNERIAEAVAAAHAICGGEGGREGACDWGSFHGCDHALLHNRIDALVGVVVEEAAKEADEGDEPTFIANRIRALAPKEGCTCHMSNTKVCPIHGAP